MDETQVKELITKAKSDPQAFGEAFDLYYPKILHYVVYRTGNIRNAQDITSETFFKAYMNIIKYDPTRGSFSSWLYRITSNEVVNFYRKNGQRVYSLEQLREDSGFDPKDKQDLEEELIQAEEKLGKHKDFLAIVRNVNRLDTKYQEVIVLQYFEQKKLTEICEITGKKLGTVKSLASRAVAKLKHLIEEEHAQTMGPRLLQPNEPDCVIS